MITRFLNWARTASLNLWLLLALFLCAGVCLVAFTELSGINSMQYRLSTLCSAAYSAYEKGGTAKLVSALEWINEGPGMGLHLLDRSGRDLANGKDYSEWLTRKQSRPWPFRLPSGPIPITVQSQYACFVEPPRALSNPPLRPGSWILPFISILCCIVATYVTIRMRRIESALRHFGSGSLQVRMPSEPGDPIGRLSRAFNQMADRIESLVSSHKQLCGDISHELRSPLGRLLLAVQLARRGTPDALDRIETEAAQSTTWLTNCWKLPEQRWIHRRWAPNPWMSKRFLWRYPITV